MPRTESLLHSGLFPALWDEKEEGITKGNTYSELTVDQAML